MINYIAPYSLEICEGFGIPESLIFSPLYDGNENFYGIDSCNGEYKRTPKF